MFLDLFFFAAAYAVIALSFARCCPISFALTIFYKQMWVQYKRQSVTKCKMITYFVLWYFLWYSSDSRRSVNNFTVVYYVLQLPKFFLQFCCLFFFLLLLFLLFLLSSFVLLFWFVTLKILPFFSFFWVDLSFWVFIVFFQFSLLLLFGLWFYC